MKTKIPSPVLQNSEVVTIGSFDNQVRNKIVVYSDTVPNKVPDGLIDNGLVIVKANTGSSDVETYPNATGASKGIVQIGRNINIEAGTISINDGTTTQKGLVQLSNSTNSSSEQYAATSKAVYDVAKVKHVVRSTTLPSAVPTNLAADGIVIVDAADGTPQTQVYPDATGASKGIVQVGNNLYIDHGVISVGSASTLIRGVVQLSNALDSDSEVHAATSKAIHDLGKIKSVVHTSKVPSSVPSNLTSDGIVIVDTANGTTQTQIYPSATGASKGIVQVGANLKINDGVVSVDLASTSTRGIVQLSNAIDSNSEAHAATSKAVYDLSKFRSVLNASKKPDKAPSNLLDNGLLIVDTAVGTESTEVYPSATGASKGIVQIGTNLSVANGVVSVSDGTVNTKGVVQLSSATNSTSENLAATSKALKITYDIAHRADTKEFVQYSAAAVTKVPTNLVNNGIVIVETGETIPNQVYPSATGASKGIVQIGTNLSVTNGVVSVATGSTSTAGVVKLSDSTSSSSSTEAATSKAVKAAYDLADSAKKSKYVVFVSSAPSTVPSGLVDGGIVIVA